MSLLFSQLRIFFPHVTIAKPRSSRNSSIEVRKKLRNENVIRGKAKNLTENILLCEYLSIYAKHVRKRGCGDEKTFFNGGRAVLDILC